MALNLVQMAPTKGGRIAAEDIHDDVKLAVEEAYEACQGNRSRISTGDALFKPENKSLYDALAEGFEKPEPKDIAEAFLHQARSYAYQREPRVIVSGNPTAKGEARFRVDLYVAETAETSP